MKQGVQTVDNRQHRTVVPEGSKNKMTSRTVPVYCTQNGQDTEQRGGTQMEPEDLLERRRSHSQRQLEFTGRELQYNRPYKGLQRSAVGSPESSSDQPKHVRKLPRGQGMNHWKSEGENPQSIHRARNSSIVEKPHNTWGTEQSTQKGTDCFSSMEEKIALL